MHFIFKNDILKNTILKITRKIFKRQSTIFMHVLCPKHFLFSPKTFKYGKEFL